MLLSELLNMPAVQLWLRQAVHEFLSAALFPAIICLLVVQFLQPKGRFVLVFAAVGFVSAVSGFFSPCLDELTFVLKEPPKPEPTGLAAGLRALPAQRLGPKQLEELERTGMTVVRGALPNRELLRKVAVTLGGSGVPEKSAHLWRLRQLFMQPPGRAGLFTVIGLWLTQDLLQNVMAARFHTRWLGNGAIRSVLRDSPVGGIASQALGNRGARVLLTEVWIRRHEEERRRHPMPINDPRLTANGTLNWHRDDASFDPCPGWSVEPAPLLTTWLALTDAPNSLQFLLGSHKNAGTCMGTLDDGYCSLDYACLEGPYLKNLTRDQGQYALKTLSLKAGDVVVFHGLTYHRGVGGPRAALCARFVPADYPYMGSMARQMEYHLHEYWRYKPHFCQSMDSVLFPVVFPKANSTVDAQEWPVSLSKVDLFMHPLGSRRTLVDYPLPQCRRARAQQAAKS